MLDTSGATPGAPRAFLRVGGATLAQHQLGIARALGCRRIVCLARGRSPDLIALQHDAEAAGMQFHVIGTPQELSSQVTAADELVAMAEGLFADPDEAANLLARGPAILVQPVENAREAGFERLDANNAAAGLIAIPGHLVEALHALPPDCDALSALTHIALQRGVRMREVPAAVRSGIGWRMVTLETEAQAIEDAWLKAQIGAGRGGSPGFLLARTAVRNFGPSLLHSGSGSKSVALAALVGLGLAVAAGWLLSVTLGFLIAGAAWVLVRTAGLLRNVERNTAGTTKPTVPRAQALGWAADVALALIAVWGVDRHPGEGFLDALFAPAALLLLIRFVGRTVDGLWSRWIRDRALLAFVLALLSMIDLVRPGLQVMALALLLAALLVTPDHRG